MSTREHELGELERALASVQRLRRSSRSSLLLMAVGVLILVGSVAYSLTRLRPLEERLRRTEAQVAAKQRELRELEETALRYADENRRAQAQLDAVRAQIASTQAQLARVQAAPTAAAAETALQGAERTIRLAERTASPAAVFVPAPQGEAARGRRAALIEGLFAERAAQRIQAYDALMSAHLADPELVPELLAYARAHRDNLNGVYNTLVVLNRLSAGQLQPHAAEVRAFLDEVRPLGPRIADRADRVGRKLPR